MNLYNFAWFLLAIGCEKVFCDNINSENARDYENNDYRILNREIDEKYRGDEFYDKDFGYSYIGNPDDFADIERPCPVYDLPCVRRFFANHSKCRITSGPIPDPLYLSQDTVYVAFANATGTPTSVDVTGLLYARIEEFYINRATNNLVIAINFQNLTVSPSRITYFRFYRKGREPITKVGPTYFTYPSMTATMIIPNIDDLQFDKAEVTGYSDDAFPPLAFGPGIFDPTEPAVVASFAAILSDVPTAVQEVMLTQSPIFPTLYIQYNLCDFGRRVS